MLREDELALAEETGPRLAELAQLGVDLAVLAAVEGEAGDRVAEAVGHQREDGPPVAGRARGGAGLGDRVATAEEHVVDGPDVFGRFVARNLSQAGHGISSCWVQGASTRKWEIWISSPRSA